MEDIEVKRAVTNEEKLEFFHNRVKKMVEYIYPGQWDFRKAVPEDNLAGSENEAYVLLIHFPDITITNSSRNSHKIKDIFVRAVFLGMRFATSGIQGCRTKLSSSEVGSGYSHSHLPGIGNGFSNFCLGSTAYAHLIAELCHSKWIDNPEEWEIRFEAFLFQLESYLSWESIEGTPHRRIENIGSGSSNNNVDLLRMQQATMMTLKFLRDFNAYEKLKFIVNNKDSTIELVLTEEIEEVFTVASDTYCYRDHLGNFYNTLSEAKTGKISGQDPIIFKNVKIYPTYIDSIKSNDSRKKYAHRSIVNYIKNELERKFRSIWFEQTYPVYSRRKNIIAEARQTYYSSTDVLKDYTIVQSSE